jgi:hypothetical protein
MATLSRPLYSLVSASTRRTLIEKTTNKCPEFIRRLDVVNRGFSGFNTDHALKHLPDIFPERTASSPKLDYLVSCHHLT